VRQYDAESGRFTSPDPFKGYLSDPASQNPYMYCRGNPIKYSDPSGYAYDEATMDVWDKVFGFLAGSDTATKIFEKIDASENIWSAVWISEGPSYTDEVRHVVYIRKFNDENKQISHIANEMGHVEDYENNPSDYVDRHLVQGKYRNTPPEKQEALIEWSAIDTEHKIMEEKGVPYIEQ
jgi:hypothetical protein